MPFLQIRDIRIYYEQNSLEQKNPQIDNAPRLLYFGGTGSDLRKKPNVFNSPLAEKFEILAFDQRGLGQSDRPDFPYTMQDYADDGDALMEALGWSSAHVMGVSFGGMVAQEFAIRYPHRVERMILACTSSGGAGGASYPLHELEELSVHERMLRIMELGDTRLNEQWRHENPDDFAALVEMGTAASSVGADEAGRENGAKRQIEARKYHDTYDRLPQIQAPTFIGGGRFDAIAPPANQETLLRQIPNATQKLFEGGHGFLMQDPQAYVEIIGFLK